MKRLLRVLTGTLVAVIVILCMNKMTVQAEGEWEAPVWTNYGTAEAAWTVPEGLENYDRMYFVLQRGGAWVIGVEYLPKERPLQPGQVITHSFGMDILTSGEYTLQIVTENMLDNGQYVDAYASSLVSETFNYTAPSTRLSTPINLRWEDTRSTYSYDYQAAFATMCCDPVDGATDYYFAFYVDGQMRYGFSAGRSGLPMRAVGDKISDPSEHEYTFKVYAVSGDITVCQHSEYSEFSVPFQSSNVVNRGEQELSDLSDDVTVETVDTVVEEVKGIEDLQTVLQTSNEAVQDLENIEGKYKDAHSITENAPVSNFEGISAAGIEVTGAALNVSANTQLGLKIDAPSSYPALDTDIYKNTIVFDMGIETTDGTDFSQELAIPVTIKLPFPEGHNPENFRVLHFKADGTFETITPRIEGGFVYITVTHFSQFAFTNVNEKSAPAVETVMMYRLYNPNSGEHFYTGSIEERDYLVSLGWNFEGNAWEAPVTSDIPVFRLYNPNAGDHHYTPSAEERDNLIEAGWNYEGIAWYSASPEGKPLHRLYNPNAVAGAHHYTMSEEERDYLVSLGWQYEGIGWFGA